GHLVDEAEDRLGGHADHHAVRPLGEGGEVLPVRRPAPADRQAALALAEVEAVGRAERDQRRAGRGPLQRVANALLTDVRVRVARLRRLALAADEGEPLRMGREVPIRVQAEPGVPQADRPRPAHAVVALPLLEILVAGWEGPEAVEHVPADRE